MSTSRDETRHGLKILFWTLVFGIALSIALRSSGNKYVQGILWPSDLRSFSLLDLSEGDVEIAIIGSSRASFGISPTRLDACLNPEAEPRGQSYNLARTFATARSAHILARDLLDEERTPEILVLAIGPEFFDEFNHRTAADLRAHLDWSDIPRESQHVSDAEELLALASPLVDGIERSGLVLAQRHRNHDHLRWMMTRHRGGQFCLTESGDSSETTACEHNNRAVEATIEKDWNDLPSVADRFEHYSVGDGPVHAHMLELLEWAEERDVTLMVAELPLHREFLAQVPATVTTRYRSYLDDLVQTHGLVHFRSEDDTWSRTRSRFLDPDHLSDRGNRRYTNELCEALRPLLED